MNWPRDEALFLPRRALPLTTHGNPSHLPPVIARHIHHALAQVQEMQQLLETQRFHGFSGRARAAGGALALLGAIALGTGVLPATPRAHLLAWGAVLLLSLASNGGALLYWFLLDPVVDRNPRRLRPVLDAIPPLAVGAVLSAALILQGDPPLLFGAWMCLFGLANLTARHVLPRAIRLVGAFYLACGAACLLLPPDFLNPWPMGLVFFVGELSAGVILHLDGSRGPLRGPSLP